MSSVFSVRSWLAKTYLLGMVVSAAGLTAVAQEDILIQKEGARKSALDLSGLVVSRGAPGAEFLEVLRNDLVRSGWFQIVARGSGSLALRGTVNATTEGAAVQCEVLNRASDRCFLRSSYTEQGGVRAAAHRLADEIVKAVKGVPGMASMRIAMIGAHGARKDLYVCDADGHNMMRLTQEGAVCLSPKWWPDSRALVYTSFHKQFPDVYKIDLVTNQRTKLAGFPGLNAGGCISPDGQSMALILSKDGNPELYVMDLGSRRLTRLTVSPHASEASPSWSPDGRELAYVSDSSGRPEIYRIGRRGGKPTRISLRGQENVAPDWGPDGRIAYSSRREGKYQICIYDPRRKSTEQVTSQYVDHEEPSWAPDGRHLVYVRTVNYQSDLYLLDTMGDASVRLTTMQGDWYSPACSR